MRQTLYILYIILLGLSSSERIVAQSTSVDDASTALIRDYANILFFSGSQEVAIGYLYYLYEARPEQQIETVIPLSSWLELMGRSLESEELLQHLFSDQPERAHTNKELVEHYLSTLYKNAQVSRADSLLALLPSNVSHHPDVLYIQLLSLYEQKKFEEVIELLDKIDLSLLTDTKQQENFNFILAGTTFELKDYKRTLEATEHLIELDPTNIAGYEMRLHAINALGLDDQLKSSLKRMQDIFSLPDEYMDARLAELISYRNDIIQSANFLHSYLERQDTISATTHEIVSILLPHFSDINQIPEEYIPALVRLAELNPKESTLFADVYKIVLLHQGKSVAEQLLKQFYENPKTAFSAVLLHASSLNDEERLNYITDARKRYPSDLQILGLYAFELISREYLEEALQAISSHINLDDPIAIKQQQSIEGLKELLLYTSLIYQRQEDKQKTLQTFELAEQIFPRDPILLNNYAYYLYTLALQDKDSTLLARAEQIAATAYSVAPEEPNILDTYGTILLARGNATMAQLMLSQAVAYADRLGSPNAGYIERLGDAYLLGGDIEAALEQWLKAYELRPSNPLLIKIQEHNH